MYFQGGWQNGPEPPALAGFMSQINYGSFRLEFPWKRKEEEDEEEGV